MAVLGTITYLPQPKFWMNRAYLREFGFGFNIGADITQVGREFFITDSTNPVVHVYCRLSEKFFDWSSNGYTLDYVLEDWWLIIDPSPTPLPLNANLWYRFNVNTGKMGLLLYLSGSTDQYIFPLPNPTQPYWWPP